MYMTSYSLVRRRKRELVPDVFYPYGVEEIQVPSVCAAIFFFLSDTTHPLCLAHTPGEA